MRIYYFVKKTGGLKCKTMNTVRNMNKVMQGKDLNILREDL